MSTATFQMTFTTTHDLSKRTLAEIEEDYAQAKAYILSATGDDDVADTVVAFKVEVVQLKPDQQPLTTRLAAAEAFIRGLYDTLNEHGDAGMAMHKIDVFFGADPYAP